MRRRRSARVGARTNMLRRTDAIHPSLSSCGAGTSRRHSTPHSYRRIVGLPSALALFILLWWRRAARLYHFLQRTELYSADRLVLSDRKVLGERIVRHVQRQRVAMLVDRPLEFRRIGVPRPHVLGLQVLDLPACRSASS
uniref:Uncharacterized protein n=1 Tax=Prymnesium polylepis TaxID=72548 RepID=A0A7S4JGZ6_9EUKA